MSRRAVTTILLAASVALGVLVPAPRAEAIAPPGRFVITTNGTPDDPSDDTVLDVKTQLRWERTFSPLVTWGAAGGPGTAQAWCASLSVATYTSGWRLPTVKELVSIVDVRSHPAFDAKVFPGIHLWIESGSTPRFWSVTPYAPSATAADGGAPTYTSAWIVAPGSGHVQPWGVTSPNVARCVRSP